MIFEQELKPKTVLMKSKEFFRILVLKNSFNECRESSVLTIVTRCSDEHKAYELKGRDHIQVRTKEVSVKISREERRKALLGTTMALG